MSTTISTLPNTTTFEDTDGCAEKAAAVMRATFADVEWALNPTCILRNVSNSTSHHLSRFDTSTKCAVLARQSHSHAHTHSTDTCVGKTGVTRKGRQPRTCSRCTRAAFCVLRTCRRAGAEQSKARSGSCSACMKGGGREWRERDVWRSQTLPRYC